MPTRQLAKISLPFLIDGSEKHCASIKHVRIQSRHAHKAGMRTSDAGNWRRWQVAGLRSHLSSHLPSQALTRGQRMPWHRRRSLHCSSATTLLFSNNTAHMTGLWRGRVTCTHTICKHTCQLWPAGSVGPGAQGQYARGTGSVGDSVGEGDRLQLQHC